MSGMSWTPEDEKQLIKLYTDISLTYEQIGKKLRRTSGSVEARIGKLRKAGILDYRHPIEKWTTKEKEKLIELYTNTSFSCNQVASELGRSYCSVQGKILQLLNKGTLKKKQYLWTIDDDEKLIELWNVTTLTYEQIGDKLGRSFDSVEIRIRKLRKAGHLSYRAPKKVKNQYEKDLTNVRELTPEGAYFITALLGDGHLRNRRVEFKFRKRDCIEFRNVMCHILSITPPLNICWTKARRINWKKWKRKIRPPGHAGRFYIYSTELAELLKYIYGLPVGAKSGQVKLPRLIMKSTNPKLHGGVLRAAYECEGGVNLHNRTLCITISNTSVLFLQDLSELLDRYKIVYNIYGSRLRISTPESVTKFYELAYGVFDLKQHITAKKTGLETLIKRKAKKRSYKRRNEKVN